MSYDYTTDFLGLLRLTGSTLRSERMPGLDWAVSALNRMGLFTVAVQQTAPTTNQTTTVWFKPGSPSWSVEGTTYLWNSAAGAYQVATPTLWQIFLAASNVPHVFQLLTAANNVINAGTNQAAVQRVAPVATTITLPSVDAFPQDHIEIFDFSTGIVGTHTITLTPTGAGTTIMQQASWNLLSTTDSLAGITLQAVPQLNTWGIAP